MKNWPEPTSVRDIQVFIDFANFYWCFIQGFSKIAALLTLLLKAIGSSNSAPKAFKANDNEIVGVGSKVNRTFVNLFKNKKSRNLKQIPNFEATKKPIFLIPNAKKAFNHLELAFDKASIFWHFKLESYIWIKTNASGYAISGVLSQLNLNPNALPNNSNLNKSDFGQCYPIAYFSRKMIPVKTQYEIHDAKLLAIVEAFKTWRYYLEGCKHKVFILTNYNNLQRFINTKNLSSL